ATSSPTFTTATSSTFDVVPGVAATLAFSIQPSNSVAGNALSPAVQVEIRDAQGNVVTTARDAVQIGIATNAGPGGTLTGTKEINAINGIASFSGLWIDKAGLGYTLGATSGSLTNSTSSTFNIVPGAKAKLVFTGQASNVAANTAISPNVTVRFADQFDNLIFSGNDPITISLGG